MICTVKDTNRIIAENTKLADSFAARFRGLMLKKDLPRGEALLLKNCSAVHCLFMRFTIDVIYLDKSLRIAALETIKPWRLGRIVPGARHVLELPEGAAEGLEKGMQLMLKED